jgi:hypothetical protein
LFFISSYWVATLAHDRFLNAICRVSSIEPTEREGVVLAISEIILGLAECQRELEINEVTLNKIQQIIPIILKKRLFRGKGGEYVRAAVSRFMECVALSRLPCPPALVKTVRRKNFFLAN